jgi:hypothetical protein
MDSDQQTSVKSITLEQEFTALMHQDASDALIAQAVRSAALPVLPADFAAQVAGTLASKTEDTSSELGFAVALLVLLGLSGLWYAITFVMENFGARFKTDLPLIVTLLTIVAMVQFWEVLKKLAGQRNQTRLLF